MDKIKRFIDCFVPVSTCNLRCHYCYITQHGLFKNKPPKFKYSPKQVAEALSKKRLGGTCLINFCGGGETLYAPDVIDYIKELLKEGHYVMVVSNGVLTPRYNEIIKFPKEHLNRLFFKFSYHYIELKKRNLLPIFWSNIKKIREAGASFTLEATPSDELIPFIDEMIKEAIENVGAANHVTVARDERDPAKLPILTSMTRDEYRNTWNKFDSSFFKYKESVFGIKRKEFCYAGDWSFYLNLGTGIMTQCYCSFKSQNIFKDPDKPIEFLAIGQNCREHHCYNAHAFLALGDIPELEAPTYAEIRNRVCLDGSEWLRPDMKAFMSTKLYESNKEYSNDEKKDVNKKIRRLAIKKDTVKVVKNIIQHIKGFPND